MGQYIIPRLKDDKEFENLIEDYYRKHVEDYCKEHGLSSQKVTIAPYGRNGQKQYGIDITVQLKNELLWCIQCKNKTSISVNDIDEIIKKCTFYGKQPFQKLIIATAAANDTKINDHLMEVSSKGIPYAIEYLPWDKISDFIEGSPEIYEKYYKNLELDDPLRKKFFELLKWYEILAFIEIDPITEGLSENIPENIDRFVVEISKELRGYFGRKDFVYRKIYEFKGELENYTTDLAAILFYPQPYTRFMYLPPYNGVDLKFKEKNEMVEKYRKSLSQLLKQINLGGNCNPISETEG